MEGWCTLEKANKLAEFVYCSEASICVELGVFGGRSLLPMAFALDQLDLGGVVYGVDTWRKIDSLDGENSLTNNEWWSSIDLEDIYKKFLNSVILNNVTDHVNILRMRSDDASVFFGESVVEVIHQDSNHSEDIGMKEISDWWTKLKLGGIWIIDDVDWDSQKNTIKKLDSISKLIHDGGTWKAYQKLNK